MSDRTDAELMELYAEGSAEAFEELFARYERRAFDYFLRRTGSEDRAGDLYQELFLRLHRFRDRYDCSRPFAPWFFRVARNVLMEDLRRSMRRREVLLEDDRSQVAEAGIERQIDGRRESARLLSLIPEEHARILAAAKIQGLGYAEIAQSLGKSADAVKQCASRALRRLRLEQSAPA